jgi:hypothetical protein
VNDDTEEQLETREIRPEEQTALHNSLVRTWVTTFQAAEAMHLCLHPNYVKHSEDQLALIVAAALQQHRGPSQMLAELLADGARSLARPGLNRAFFPS